MINKIIIIAQDDAMRKLHKYDYEKLVGLIRENYIPYVTGKDRYIQHFNPHYTDGRFKTARTVYLANGYKLKRVIGGNIVPEAHYDYSDRIRQWDWDKSHKAWLQVRRELGSDIRVLNTAKANELYLRYRFNAPDLKLIHILAGHNLTTGYPYQVFGYVKANVDSNIGQYLEAKPQRI